MKLTLIFIAFGICHFIYQYYNMYVAKFASSLSLFGITFSSYWTYALGSLLIASPLLLLANYGFSIGFYAGYKYTDKIWLIVILFISAQLLTILTSGYLIFNELPSKGTLLGFLMAIGGLLIANLWK